MLDFFIKKIIGSDDLTGQTRHKIINITGFMGLFFNIFLFAVKFGLGLWINSISIMGDSFNNLSDSLNSIITIIAAKISKKPADLEHPFGHGRSEYIATLAIGISIIIVGIQLFKSSISSIFYSQKNTISLLAIIIMILTILVKFYMYLFNKKVFKMLNSEINRSQMVDSRNDVVVTSLVVLALFVKRYTNLDLEAYAAIVLAGMIIKSGIEIFMDMGNILLGEKIDDQIKENLINILIKGRYVRGIHGIKIHNYGHNILTGSAHVEVPANIDLFTIHNIIDDLEKEVKHTLNIDLTLHMDPKYLLEKDSYASLEKDLFIDERRKNDN